MTYRIYPTTDGRWRFGVRVYETLIEARRELTQTFRRLHRKRRAAMALAHFLPDHLSLSLYGRESGVQTSRRATECKMVL